MKFRLIALILFFSSINVLGQDAEFSMPNSSPLYLSPSMAGIETCSRLVVNYRNQWPGLKTSQTGSFSYDKYFHALRGGLGLMYVHDSYNDNSFWVQNLRLMYAGHINLGGTKYKYLRPSVYIGLGHRDFDPDKLYFGNLIDPRYGYVYHDNIGYPQGGNIYFDVGAGLLFSTNRFLVSVAAEHLNEPDEGILGNSKLPMKIKAYTKYDMEFNASWCFNPQLFYVQQQDFQAIVPVLAFTMKQTLRFGGGTRFNTNNVDAVIGMIGVDLRRFTIQYSYDYTVSKLTNTATGGSHEVGLRYIFGCEKRGEYFTPPAYSGF